MWEKLGVVSFIGFKGETKSASVDWLSGVAYSPTWSTNVFKGSTGVVHYENGELLAGFSQWSIGWVSMSHMKAEPLLCSMI